MFIFLAIGLLKIKDVDKIGNFFIDNMGIFFVPGAIAILNNIQIISEIWWKLIIIILGGFVVSFTATYWSVRLTLILQDKHKQKKLAKKEKEYDA